METKTSPVKLLAACLGLAVLIGLAPGCGGKGGAAQATPGGSPGTDGNPAALQVSGGKAVGGVAPAEYGVRAKFFTAWVGSFLDEAPARTSVAAFQKQGWASFAVKKTLVEMGPVKGKPIGDYWLVMVGLFGERADAESLGRLLKAQGQITNWQVVPSDNPGEMGQAAAQTEALVNTGERVTQAAQEKAGQPLAPSSPTVTGKAFKNLVEGRYVGSFRDSLEAQREAARLTAAGWPASVATETESGGMWYRVILAQPTDRRDFKAEPAEVERARASAAAKEGLVFLVDTSGAKGTWGRKDPEADRKDASGCAGFSRAGRLRSCLERLIGYIPDSGILVAVKPITLRQADGVVAKVVRPVKAFFTGDESEYSEAKSAYGPSVYNRPDMMARVKSLTVSERPVPISPALDALNELAAIPGRKTVILYSEFGEPSDASKAMSALGNLKGQYGGSLRVFAVYGDADDKGWELAENVAKTGGTGQAWNGCKLLFDNAYFESFVKTIFSR